MHTANFRRQHDDARARISDIEMSLACPAFDSEHVSHQLMKLGGLLQIHFAMEDRSLYPAMLGSKNADAARTASAYQHEMGGISPTLSSFVGRWRVPAAIRSDVEAFKAECSVVLPALRERMDREDQVLYPLADRTFQPAMP